MADDATPVSALRDRVGAFVRERDWEKYPRPANLAKAISVEAAELLELFQWRGDSDPMDAALRARLEEELADVVIYCLSAANAAGVGPSDAGPRKPGGGRARGAPREP